MRGNLKGKSVHLAALSWDYKRYLKMTEWNILLNVIQQSIGHWPRELIPLIAGYLRVRVNEWHYELSGHQSVTFKGRHCLVEHADRLQSDGDSTTTLTSKYPVGLGPSRWTIDVDISRWSGLVWLGLEISGLPSNWRSHWMKSFNQGEVPKYSLSLEIDRENKVAVFKYRSYSSSAAEMERLASFNLSWVENGDNLDTVYPSVMIVGYGECTVTLVEE
jgi:hypothetical protein